MDEDIKRITIKTSATFHKEIKQRSLYRNVTMTKYIMRALWEQIKREKQYEEQEPKK